jgi:hypothetical protein
MPYFVAVAMKKMILNFISICYRQNTLAYFAEAAARKRFNNIIRHLLYSMTQADFTTTVMKKIYNSQAIVFRKTL